MYFKEAEHRHDSVGSEVGRTIVIAFLEMDMRKVDDVLQVTLELPDKILREFYGASVTIRFVGGEMMIVWSSHDTHYPGGDVDKLEHLYRVRTSWSSM
jgi:hypothetical protein